MKRRFNHTSRQKIRSGQMRIQVSEDLSFQMVLDLRENTYPPDAQIFLEVTCAGNSVVKRFEDVGKIGDFPDGIVKYKNALRPFTASHFTFTIKIVDTNDDVGKILATGAIGTGKNGETSLLFLESSDELDEIPWRLVHNSSSVILELNRKYESLYEKASESYEFQALILPPVLREILNLTIAQYEPDDSDCIWTLWGQFAVRLHPNHQEIPSGDDLSEKDDWINMIVNQFCKEHKFLKNFNNPRE